MSWLLGFFHVDAQVVEGSLSCQNWETVLAVCREWLSGSGAMIMTTDESEEEEDERGIG